MRTDPKKEARLRRMAARQGLALCKSRRRNPYACDYGTYGLYDVSMNGLVASGGEVFNGYGLDLDEVEEWLRQWAEA